jgi:hypothetical protein
MLSTAIEVMLTGFVPGKRVTDEGVHVNPFQFKIVVPDPAAHPCVLSTKNTSFKDSPFAITKSFVPLFSFAQLSAPSFVVWTITGTAPPVACGMKPTAQPLWPPLLGSKVIDLSVMFKSGARNGWMVKAPPVLVDCHTGPEPYEVPVAQASDPLVK